MDECTPLPDGAALLLAAMARGAQTPKNGSSSSDNDDDDDGDDGDEGEGEGEAGTYTHPPVSST